MIRKSIREAHYFLYSQAFADGIRASVAIILPALIGYYTGYFEYGLTISLGAMCISLTDAPGPLIHRWNGMLIALGLSFFTALMTAFARGNLYWMAIEIAVFTFLYSMFSVYGNRAASVGNAAMLVMILTMDSPLDQGNNIVQALLILAGGFFYLVLSLLIQFLQPYRNAQRALGECLREIAAYLQARSSFYDLNADVQETYRRVISRQVSVQEKQDAVREHFFKTRKIVQESTEEGRKLVYTFVETVDLFENITASYYDYDRLREQFSQTGALEIIHASLNRIVGELDRMGVAIQNNSGFEAGFDYDEEIRRLKESIDRESTDGNSALVLKKIVVNVRNLLLGLSGISTYFNRQVKRKKSNVDHSRFVSHQPLHPVVLWNNFSLESSIFRHAVRVCIACLAGFFISRGIAYGEHSYWILLTIAFILKPAFSLTRKRNIERILGTLAGGLVGILLLAFVTNTTLLFIFLILFMIGTYSFLRINYLVMVFFTTPYILILFSFLGFLFSEVARERILDTLIGCAIALLVSYFLFPKWESQQLNSYMKNMLKANKNYLQKILETISGKKPGWIDYKLARKEVFLSSANLSAAFDRMISEPKHKQGATSQVHTFVVLNHILFSNLASIGSSLMRKEPLIYPEEIQQLVRKSEWKLEESIQKLEQGSVTTSVEKIPTLQASEGNGDELLKEQMQFIYSVSNDIERTVRKIVSGTIEPPAHNH